MKRIAALLSLWVLSACSSSSAPPDYAAAEQALMQRQSQRVLDLLARDASPEGERLKATASLQLQDLDAAARHLDSAVASGGSGAVFADYARLELIRGQLGRAAAFQTRAEQAGGQALMTLLTGGEIALAQGQPQRALNYFDRAAELYPGNLAVLGDRARALAELGQWETLAPLVKVLEAKAPGDPDVAALRQRLNASR